MPDNKELNDSLKKTIDSVFSDTPGAPVSLKDVKKEPPKTVTRTAPVAPKAEATKEAAVKEPAPAAPKAEVPAKPKAEVPAKPKAEAVKEAAPAAPKAALTVSELKKLLGGQREQKPVEKASPWVMILTACAMTLCFSAAFVAIVAAYFYFGPGAVAADGNVLLAWMAMAMCAVVCVVFVGFVLGLTFVFRRIEKDIREIKSKL